MTSALAPGDPLHIGLFHELVATPGGLIVGRQVAVDELIRALSGHGEATAVDLFCPTLQRAALESQIRSAAGTDGARVQVRDLRDLADGPDPLGLTAWHDPVFDTYRPFALRGLATRPYPITILHHTLSYRELLHDNALRLLLSDPQPHDSLICTSTAARDALRRIVERVADRFNDQYGTRLAYRGRYDVIPLGVDVERFRPRDKPALRASLGLPTDALILLCLGRLSPVDKADLLPLLDAFAHLCAANPSRELLLICGGSERPSERYATVVQDRAAELGIADRLQVVTELADAHLWHAAADVFVSLSDNLQESFGLAPVEAMACGVPQLVSDWNGHRDTVEHGHTGLRVATAWAHADQDLCESAFVSDSAVDHLMLGQSVAIDPDAIEQALQLLLDDESLRLRLGEQSRQRALERFAWPVVVSRYRSLWSELADRCRAEPRPQTPPARYALPAYFADFEHYPSMLLDDETALRLTDRGRAVVTTGSGFPGFYNFQWGSLRADLVRRVMGGVIHADQKGQSITVGRIADVIGKSLGGRQPRALVTRHVLWLLKYGLVRTEQASHDGLALPTRTHGPAAPQRAGAPPSDRASGPADTVVAAEDRPSLVYFTSPYVSHAEAARRYLRCMESLPIDVLATTAAAPAQDLPERLAKAQMVLIHDEPPAYPTYFERFPALRSTHVVAFAVWETDRLPEPYRLGLSLVDEVWTCSEFARQALQAVEAPVHVVPHVVPAPQRDDEAARALRERLDLPAEAFTFYTICDATNPRKNLIAALNAFTRCFPDPTDAVRLVIKPYRRSLPGLSQFSNVMVLDEMLSARDLAALHQVGDCYLSAHCAEAWGLPISDAMAQGNLVIATGHSGNMEYMSDENSLPVAYRVEPIRAEDRGWQPELLDGSMRWAYVDLDDLCAKLRLAFDARGDAERQLAAQRIVESFGPETITRCIEGRLRHHGMALGAPPTSP
jgi:glycosyltransferase involved in cell wall biosynthesis